jgi:PQQ-dependent catabolism-associated CXXCW motif protein
MGKLSLLLIAALWSIAPLAANDSPDPSGQSAFATLGGLWQVQVEGESRLRQFAVYGVKPATADQIALVAGYGWADGELAYVDATATLKEGKLQLTITTPASAAIHAEQIDANTFRGTFTSKSGNSKPMHMSRIVLELANIDRPFADEDKDFGVAPTKTLTTTYHQETPLSVPGAITIKTLALKKLIDSATPPVVIDALGGTPGKRVVIPTAVWLGFDAGDGRVFAAERAKFAAVLSKLTNADKSKPIVFYCLGVECWLSYNAALRAVEEGYKNVYWYRGGWESWKAARMPFVKGEQYAW